MGGKSYRAKPGAHMCELFFCDRRRERYCCEYCGYKKHCRNPCLNTPGKCGKDFIQGDGKHVS